MKNIGKIYLKLFLINKKKLELLLDAGGKRPGKKFKMVLEMEKFGKMINFELKINYKKLLMNIIKKLNKKQKQRKKR